MGNEEMALVPTPLAFLPISCISAVSSVCSQILTQYRQQGFGLNGQIGEDDESTLSVSQERRTVCAF